MHMGKDSMTHMGIDFMMQTDIDSMTHTSINWMTHISELVKPSDKFKMLLECAAFRFQGSPELWRVPSEIMFCGFDEFYALVWFPVQYVMMMRSRLDRHISRSPSHSHKFSTVYLIIVAKLRLLMTSTVAYMYLHLAAFTPGSEKKFQNLYKRLYIITII